MMRTPPFPPSRREKCKSSFPTKGRFGHFGQVAPEVGPFIFRFSADFSLLWPLGYFFFSRLSAESQIPLRMQMKL